MQRSSVRRIVLVAVSIAVLLGAGLMLAGSGSDGPGEGYDTSVRVPPPGNTTTLYFFWGNTCPVCEEMQPFIEDLDAEYPDLRVRMYEVYDNRTNQDRFKAVAAAYGTRARAVPMTFLGQDHWTGFTDRTRSRIESAVQSCLDEGCSSPLDDGDGDTT